MNEFTSDGTLSVSKGFFVFKNKTGSRKKKRIKTSSNYENDFFSDNWYKSYRSSWISVQEGLKRLYSETFSNILSDVVSFAQNAYGSNTPKFQENIIPVAALLTGINIPDHAALFESLNKSINLQVTHHIAFLHGRECKNVKSAIERMVSQFINDVIMEDLDDDLNYDSPTKYKKLKKSQFNLPQLETWYKDIQIDKDPCGSPKLELNNGINSRRQLVVIIPDFETFPCHVLNDFILICSSYVPNLPFVLILGVATSALSVSHRLPHTVSSKVCIQLFQTPPSTKLLNCVIEKVLLSNATPFRLGNKAFKFLSDNFLFYDFSVQGFIQGYKMCMLEHFMGKEWTALCCPFEEAESIINTFDTKQLDLIRGLPSYRLYVESLPLKERGLLLLNDDYFKKHVVLQLKELHAAKDGFHVGLNCLHMLTSNLPTSPLGKNFRELYGLAISSNVTDSPEFKQSFQLLATNSLEEIIDKLDNLLVILDNNKVVELKKQNLSLPQIKLNLYALKVELENERKKKDLESCSTRKNDTEFSNGSAKMTATETSNCSPRRAVREIYFGSPRHGDTEFTGDTKGSTRKGATELSRVSPRKAALREISFDTPKKCTKTRASEISNLSPRKLMSEILSGTPKKRIADSPTKRITDSPTKRITDSPTKRITDSPKKRITDSPKKRITDSPKKRGTEGSTDSPKKRVTEVSSSSPRKMSSELSLISPRKRGTGSPRNEDKNISSETPKKNSFLLMDKRMNSFKLKKTLLELKDQKANNDKISSHDRVTQKLWKYLASDVFPAIIAPLTNYPLHEIFLFDNVARIKTRIVGTTRAAIHTALSNPQFYLECDCCELPAPGSLLPTLPDICIAYKLHLECGRLISLADWLQAFASVVSPIEEDSEIEIDPHVQNTRALSMITPHSPGDELNRTRSSCIFNHLTKGTRIPETLSALSLMQIRARFTRAVDELQFLGFVKATKRKLDHVCKLTWGGS